jgi:DNA modification methylase
MRLDDEEVTLGSCDRPYELLDETGRKVILGKLPKSRPGQTCKAHPCSRSTTFLNWLVWWFSDESEMVCDLNMGSGTTGIAALSHRRRFVGIEIEPRYFELACGRIEDSLKQPQLLLS